MEDFRVLITEKCNANCQSCFNKNIRCDNEMSLDNFRLLCDYLAEQGGVKKLKIMGGEPTVHPDFEEIVQHAQQKFESVHIFTNAINERIENIRLRKHDSIIYNVSCLPVEAKKSRFLLNQQGGRMFETQLSSDCNLDHIKSVLRNARNLISDDRMRVALTLNCVENIFERRNIIIPIWNDMVEFLKEELNIEHNIDHNIPYCFFLGTNMNIKVKKSMCNLKCAGLITPSMRLQYCNQSQEILQDMMIQGRMIPFNIVENRLREYYYNKMLINSKKLCRNCILFERKCNGGCFMHKSIISKESIINNIDLPLM